MRVSRPFPLLTAAVLVTVLGLAPSPASGQDLGGLIDEVGRPYAERYLQPLADALGADMNAGLFHTARIGGGLLPLVDVYAGVKLMGTLVTNEDKTFDLTYETEQTFRAADGNRYTVPVMFEIRDGPTVFGDRNPGTLTAEVNETVSSGPDGQPGTPDDVVIDTTASFDVLPGLVGTPIALWIVPQIGIGSLAGTDLVVRYLPRVGHDKYGSIAFAGVGVRHSISQYIPLFPISVSGQFMWQRLSVEDASDDEIFAASAWAANVAASKTLLVLTVYGGLQVERSNVRVDYTFEPQQSDLPGQTVAFDLTGENSFRVIAGLSFGLGPFLVNADAAVGSRTVVSTGVGLAL